MIFVWCVVTLAPGIGLAWLIERDAARSRARREDILALQRYRANLALMRPIFVKITAEVEQMRKALQGIATTFNHAFQHKDH